ncbi:MAG: hypothetical protein IPM66_06655 [Acidobacteriota bacterium]|nr:MAG: hypothetical protein IPM66_06655 [Acidobacteriota bacterium]
MRTSLKFTNLVLAICALAMMSMAALAADPGAPYPASSQVSDQKAGSLLIYNFYSSSATSSNTENTRINITNTNIYEDAFVHLFFVANSCTVADAYICLTPNQTASFLTSDFDPGFSGYILAVATNHYGEPIQFNYLIGDEYVKLTSGHAANLGAEAFSHLGTASTISTDGTTATISFDNLNYNWVPRVLALDNIPSRAGGNDTLVILNRTGGNLAISAGSIGSIFGLLYDDAENVLSFTTSGGCQKRFSITDQEPRTVPRFTTFIPSGRSGWMKLWAASNVGIVGAMINFNPNVASQADAFNGGHNLHKLTLTTDAYTMPVFPASC